MKTIRILSMMLLSLIAFTAAAQGPIESPRDITLKVVNKRGKPIAGVVVQSLASDATAAITDQKGEYVFPNMTDRDSVIILLPRYGEVIIPVAGMEAILVQQRSNRGGISYSAPEGDKMVNIGYNTIRERDRTTPGTTLDAQKIVQSNNANSLYDLLVGRVAGLDITRSGGQIKATIRGQSSLLGSNEPLVIVDGITYESLESANGAVNVRDIKSVDVLKDGAMYGSRGANGVIIITTR